MWQVLLGIYIVVSVVIVIMLWSSLVLAKRADHNTKTQTGPKADLIVGGAKSPIENETLEVPALSEFSRK
jgi:hypothetical protein